MPHRAGDSPINLELCSFPAISPFPHQADSERLKAEGNAFFSKSDFAGAYAKYTSAIELDSQNAILYSNRAACAFGLGRYDHTVSFDTKADVGSQVYRCLYGRHEGQSSLCLCLE